MLEKPLIIGANISDKYYSNVKCPCCRGKKYAATHDNVKVHDLSIGKYMTTPFADLIKAYKSIRKNREQQLLEIGIRYN